MIEGMNALSFSSLSMNRFSIPAAGAMSMPPIPAAALPDIPRGLASSGGRWRHPLFAMADVHGAGGGTRPSSAIGTGGNRGHADRSSWLRLSIGPIMSEGGITFDRIHPFIRSSGDSIILPPTSEALMSTLTARYRAEKSEQGRSCFDGEKIAVYQARTCTTGQAHVRAEFNMNREGWIDALYCFSAQDGRLLIVFLDRIEKLITGLRRKRVSTKTVLIHAPGGRMLPSEDRVKGLLKDIFFFPLMMTDAEAQSRLSVLARNALLLMAEMDDQSYQTLAKGEINDLAAWLFKNLVPHK